MGRRRWRSPARATRPRTGATSGAPGGNNSSSPPSTPNARATPAGVARAFGVLGALEGHLHTGLSAGEARDLAGWAQEQAAAGVRPRFGTAALDTAALLVAATSDSGQYILLPIAG